jgi:hypothetical protein
LPVDKLSRQSALGGARPGPLNLYQLLHYLPNTGPLQRNPEKCKLIVPFFSL